MFRELFFTYTGLLSLATIIFMLLMFGFFYQLFLKNEASELKKPTHPTDK
ncbi:MAG: DUF3149 domain-containing protein [Methylophilaceae bacterium]